MRILGNPTAGDDLDALIARLQACPTPTENAHVPAQALFSDEKAHPVSQGQLGFSATVPLGTKHIGECVALFVRDSATGKTACAHIDRFATPGSIEAIFEEFPKSGVDVIMLGARYAVDSKNKGATEDRKKLSRDNLSKVLEVLKKHDINIVAAQVQDGTQPTSLYVDPKTFLVYDDTSEHEDPNDLWVFTKMMLSGGTDSIPLDTVFDFTKSPERQPVLLRAEEVGFLNRTVNNGLDVDIRMHFNRKREFKGNRQAVLNISEMAKFWNVDYQAELNRTAEKLGVTPKSLRRKPLFVGTGATARNVEMHKSPAAKSAPKGALKNNSKL